MVKKIKNNILNSFLRNRDFNYRDILEFLFSYQKDLPL